MLTEALSEKGEALPLPLVRRGYVCVSLGQRAETRAPFKLGATAGGKPRGNRTTREADSLFVAWERSHGAVPRPRFRAVAVCVAAWDARRTNWRLTGDL